MKKLISIAVISILLLVIGMTCYRVGYKAAIMDASPINTNGVTLIDFNGQIHSYN